MGFMNFDITNSPIKEANGWANAPEDAKEFTMLTSNGYVRRPCLILKNEDGIYDSVAIYKSKKETEPMLVMGKDIYVPEFVDDVLAKDEVKQGITDSGIGRRRLQGSAVVEQRL